MCGVQKDYVAEAFEALKILIVKENMRGENIGRAYDELLKIINARPKPEEDDDEKCPCGCN
jgi:hypothetical protein